MATVVFKLGQAKTMVRPKQCCSFVATVMMKLILSEGSKEQERGVPGRARCMYNISLCSQIDALSM